MGSVCGTAFHAFVGARNSPRGERFAGSITAIKIKAPILGGNFAIWGGLFSTFDCTLLWARGKEDWKNGVAAGFFTGGALALRAGWKRCLGSAITGGVFIGLIEGFTVWMQKFQATTMRDAARLATPAAPPVDPPPFSMKERRKAELEYYEDDLLSVD